MNYKLYDLECVICNTPFKGGRGGKFCSKPCRREHNRRRYIPNGYANSKPFYLVHKKTGEPVIEFSSVRKCIEWYNENHIDSLSVDGGRTTVFGAINRLGKFRGYTLIRKDTYTKELALQLLAKRKSTFGKKMPPRDSRKLTNEQVISIYKDDREHLTIANDYGVSRPLVNKIQLGKAYTDVTGGLPRNRYYLK